MQYRSPAEMGQLSKQTNSFGSPSTRNPYWVVQQEQLPSFSAQADILYKVAESFPGSYLNSSNDQIAGLSHRDKVR